MVKATVVCLSIIAAGCASAPRPDRLKERDVAPGKEVMRGITCTSVTTGDPTRVVLRNDGGETRRLVWVARWRSADGFEMVPASERAMQLDIPPRAQMSIEFRPPSPQASAFRLLIGDRE